MRGRINLPMAISGFDEINTFGTTAVVSGRCFRESFAQA
jgi:hypothetical protein